MASARQLSKSGGLKSAASRQKLKQQQPNDRGVATVPGSSGEGSSNYPYMKEEHVLTLGEHFYNRTMVLVQQAARSSKESSLWDIADGIYKDVEGYISKEAQVRAFALLMYNKGLEDAQNAETVAKLCSRLASLEAEGLKFRSPLLKQLQEDFISRATWKDNDPNRWLAFTCYLCCLFRHLKIGDNYINALVEPVFTCLDSLKELGPTLEELKPAQMDILLNMMKEKLLGPKSSHFSRLLLLEIIELRASGWHLTDTQQQYYSEIFC
ncbi:MIF4G domain-containing protein B isoform X2 [Strongylocentrotus purpuratus]|uniref:MIF4G domain-containing protein n=1 Tax=Strongylocentrotus purpuratus TaxID=7668 RepID=A0A7M7PVQ9_STRPU|nr:MIF4G domain-containing protein B isoform X2 [Strongylocentrotus purpuratus]